MGVIHLTDGAGNWREFKIKGNAPTEKEQAWIDNRLKEYNAQLGIKEPTPEPRDPTFGESLGIGTDRLTTGLNHALSQAQGFFGDDEDALARYRDVEKSRAENEKNESQFVPVQQLWEDPSFINKAKAVYRTGVESGPQMAATIIPSVAAGVLTRNPAVAMGVGTAIGTPMFAGSNLERQVAEEGVARNPGDALAAAVPQAAADSVLAALLPGVGKVAQGAVGGLKGAGIKALETGLVEGGTEAFQQGLERKQAGLEVFDEEGRKELTQAGIMGGILGGAIGAPGGYFRGRNNAIEADAAEIETAANEELEADLAARNAEVDARRAQVNAADSAMAGWRADDFGLPSPAATTDAPRIPFFPTTEVKTGRPADTSTPEQVATREAAVASADRPKGPFSIRPVEGGFSVFDATGNQRGSVQQDAEVAQGHADNLNRQRAEFQAARERTAQIDRTQGRAPTVAEPAPKVDRVAQAASRLPEGIPGTATTEVATTPAVAETVDPFVNPEDISVNTSPDTITLDDIDRTNIRAPLKSEQSATPAVTEAAPQIETPTVETTAPAAPAFDEDTYTKIAEAVQKRGTMNPAVIQEETGMKPKALRPFYDRMAERGLATRTEGDGFRPSDQIGEFRKETTLPEGTTRQFEVKEVPKAGWTVNDKAGNVLAEFPSRNQAQKAITEGSYKKKGNRIAPAKLGYGVFEKAYDQNGDWVGERVVEAHDTREAADASIQARQPKPVDNSIGGLPKAKPQPETRWMSTPEAEAAAKIVNETAKEVGLEGFDIQAVPTIRARDNNSVIEGATTRSHEDASQDMARVAVAAHAMEDGKYKGDDLRRTTAEEGYHLIHDRLSDRDRGILTHAAETTKVPGKKYTYMQLAARLYGNEDLSNMDVVTEEAIAKMAADHFVATKNNDLAGAPEVTPEAKGVLRKIWEWLTRSGKKIAETPAGRKLLDDFASGDLGRRVQEGRAEGDQTLAAERKQRAADAKAVETAKAAAKSADATKTAGDQTDAEKETESSAANDDSETPAGETRTSEVRYSYSLDSQPGQRVPRITSDDDLRSTYMPQYMSVSKFLEKYLGIPWYHIADNVLGNIGGRKLGIQERKAQVKNGFMTLAEMFQDSMIPVANLMDMMKESGGKITDNTDVYAREEVMGAKIAARIKRRKDGIYKDAMTATNQIGATDATFNRLRNVNGAAGEILANPNYKNNKNLGVLDLWLYAKHAPERNKWIKENRYSEKNKAPDHGNFAGMTDEEAAQIVSAIEREPALASKVKAAEKKVRAIIDDTNLVRYQNGLITKEQYESEGLGQNYVPLRGTPSALEEEIDSDWEAPGFNARARRGADVRGSEDRAAAGRQSRATDIVANIMAQNEQAQGRAERNAVASSAYQLIKDNEGSGKSMMVGEIVTDPPKIKRVVNGQTKTEIDPKWKDDNHILVAKIGGEERAIRLYDAKVAQALRPALGSTPDAGHFVLRALGTLNRLLASVNTAYNPEFIVSNALRDIQTAMVTTAQFNKKGLAKKIVADWPKAFAAARNETRNGRYDGEMGKYLKKLEDLGGLTAFEGAADIETQIANLNKESQAMLGGSTLTNFEKGGQKLKAASKFILDYNQAVENTVRLSIFKNLVESGMSEARAAQAAKNATVNFNRGGRYKTAMNSLYLFYNASLQGSFALYSAATRSKKVQKALMAVMAMGFSQDMLNRMLSEKDDEGESEYDKIPEYVKEMNWILMTGPKSYIKIPMPYGMNGIHNMGRQMSKLMNGKASVGEATGSMVGNLAGVLNPLGGAHSFANFVAPTVLDPIIDIGQNTDFTGREITPDKKGGSGLDAPDSQRYWNNTNQAFVKPAEWMNTLMGGSAIRSSGVTDVSPETLQYWYEFVTGGAGRFLMTTAATGGTLKDLVDGDLDEFDVNDIMFARKFLANNTSDTDNQAYFEKRQAALTAYEEFKAAQENGDTEQMVNLQKKYGADLAAAPVIRNIESQRRKVSKQMRQIKDMKGIPDGQKQELVKAYRDQLNDLAVQGAKIVDVIKRQSEGK